MRRLPSSGEVTPRDERWDRPRLPAGLDLESVPASGYEWQRRLKLVRPEQ